MHLSDVGRWSFLSKASARQPWRPKKRNHSTAARQTLEEEKLIGKGNGIDPGGAEDDDDDNPDGPAWSSVYRLHVAC